ncbi:hypothetical protein DFP72DRAFT_867666 [Ephemerocybe angulata]|uniref:F-box domain-containing protein n=1 Tax=Ephemerocybe angulata TaxID=980116 RepID=A0A8H6IGU0_9AGAR|nr:hypothetical protein DFP72DRAFT_867666 [Tulosesus angulatus]
MMDQDRLTHLFTGNVTLNPLELDFVKHEIEARSTTIHQLEVQLGVLKAEREIHQLELQLEILKAEREMYQALLSPLRRNLLPPEILGEIFSISVSTSTKLSWDCQLNTLCHVCRVWRDAALAMPALWAHVKGLYIDAPKKLDVARVREWFKRSGSVKKTLHIDGLHRRNRSCHLSPQNELTNLLVDGPPLDTLSLTCVYAECIETIIQQVASRVGEGQLCDSLRSLHLGMIHAKSDMSLGVIWAILDVIPTIRTLSLDLSHFHFDWDVPGNLSQSNLTTFSIACDWPISLLLEILRACPNIETLILDHKGLIRRISNAVNTPVLLPKLETLRMQGLVSYSTDTDIFCHLQLPSLYTLDIAFVPIGREDPQDLDTPVGRNIVALVSGGPNQATNLQHLRFESLAISSQGLHSILSSLPMLAHLTLDKLRSQSRFFREACAFPTQLLPRLRTLRILNASEFVTFENDDVYDFLVNRKHTATEEVPDSLEEVELVISRCRPDIDKQAQRLCYLSSEVGLRVSVTIRGFFLSNCDYL